MLIFGIVMTVLGTLLPSLIDRFDVDMAEAGSSITLLSVGSHNVPGDTTAHEQLDRALATYKKRSASL